MKWVNLKIKNLPIIALEIERAIQVFTSLRMRVEKDGSKDEVRELIGLKQELKKRIAELDYFYQKHHLDENIFLFHMLKIKLQKAIFRTQLIQHQENEMQHLSMIEQKQEEKNQSLHLQNQIMMLEQPLFSYYDNNKKVQSNKKKFQFYEIQHKEQKQTKRYNQELKRKDALEKRTIPQINSHLYSISEVSKQKNKKNDKVHTKSTNMDILKNKNQIEFEQKKQKIESSKNMVSERQNESDNKSSKRQQRKMPIVGKDKNVKPINLSFIKDSVVNKEKQQKTNVIKYSKNEEKTSRLSKQGRNSKRSKPEDLPIEQGLNTSQSELKFTIKMTKQEYKSLLQMKKKLITEGRI